MNFMQPTTMDHALSLLAEGDWAILSGGTDFYPALGDKPPSGNILDISKINGLKSIEQEDEHWSIGALVTWSDLIHAPLPPAYDALKLAAREVGSIQIQNRATIAGNICNASPAADGVPALLCLDAHVKLASSRGTRVLPLAEFIIGNRQTALAPGEIVSHILIPNKAARGVSHFIKLGARKYLVISIAMAAARLEADENGIIQNAAISVGSCSLVAQRLSALEQALTGQSIKSDIGDLVAAEHVECLAPIDDVRASADYRIDASIELVRRVLCGAVGE